MNVWKDDDPSAAAADPSPIGGTAKYTIGTPVKHRIYGFRVANTRYVL